MLRRVSNPVIAVAVPNDVYLTYSIFILTSAMRVVSFSLNLRSDIPLSHPIGPTPQRERIIDEPLLKPVDGPAAYISLLGSNPFEPPPVFSRSSGLPSNPHLALPASETSKEFRLTPDTLRFLGQTVERFTAQIRDVQLADRGVQLRAALQKQEHQRQSDKFQEMKMLIDQLKGPRRQKATQRLKDVHDSQSLLLSRLSRVLQAMMKKASPALSDHETKWFEELKRMKAEVLGQGRYDEAALLPRSRMVCASLLCVFASRANYITPQATTRVRPVDSAPQSRAGQGIEPIQDSSRTKPGSRGITSFRAWATLHKRVSFTCFLDILTKPDARIIRGLRIRKMQKELVNLASKLEVSLVRPPNRSQAAVRNQVME